MHWPWQAYENLPTSVYQVLVEALEREATSRTQE